MFPSAPTFSPKPNNWVIDVVSDRMAKSWYEDWTRYHLHYRPYQAGNYYIYQTDTDLHCREVASGTVGNGRYVRGHEGGCGPD